MNDANKIKGKIIEHGYNMESFAKAIGISRQTLTKKLNGSSEFTVSEIYKICETLNIANSEIGTYFFTH